MLAICCILIASKYNECEDHVPDLQTLEDITQQSISNETVLNYELWALKRMGWKLNGKRNFLKSFRVYPLHIAPRHNTPLSLSKIKFRCFSQFTLTITARTPMAFLASYMVLGIYFPSDSVSVASEDVESRLKSEVQSLATTCMLDTRFKPYMASDVASAIVYVVRRNFGLQWVPELSAITQRDPSKGHMKEIINLLHQSSTPLLTTVFTSAHGASSTCADSYSSPLPRAGEGISCDSADSEASTLAKSKSKASPTSVTALTGEV